MTVTGFGIREKEAGDDDNGNWQQKKSITAAEVVVDWWLALA